MEQTIKNILVPTDFTACSSHALTKAMVLARQCGASITLLHVVDLNLHPPPTGPVNGERLRQELWQESRLQLDQTVFDLGAEAVGILTLIREGVPWVEIAEAARDFDLIVIGRRKQRRFWHLFSRHTVKGVIGAAPCPVLVIGEQQEKVLFGKKGNDDRTDSLDSARCRPLLSSNTGQAVRTDSAGSKGVVREVAGSRLPRSWRWERT